MGRMLLMNGFVQAVLHVPCRHYFLLHPDGRDEVRQSCACMMSQDMLGLNMSM